MRVRIGENFFQLFRLRLRLHQLVSRQFANGFGRVAINDVFRRTVFVDPQMRIFMRGRRRQFGAQTSAQQNDFMRAIAGAGLARVGKAEFMQAILATFLRPVIHVEQIYRHVGKIQHEAAAKQIDQFAARVGKNFLRAGGGQHGVRFIELANKSSVTGFDEIFADGQAAKGTMIFQLVAIVAGRAPLGHPDAPGQRSLAADHAEIIRPGSGSDQGRRQQK